MSTDILTVLDMRRFAPIGWSVVPTSELHLAYEEIRMLRDKLSIMSTQQENHHELP